MSRTFRCRYTAVHRCEAEGVVRLRLTYSVGGTPQLTRVCAAHAVTLADACIAADIKFERV